MTQVSSSRSIIASRMRKEVLKNIAAQILEHGVSMEELDFYIEHEYQTLSEQVQSRRNRLDVRMKRSQAATASQEKRKQRHAEWNDKRQKQKELPDVLGTPSSPKPPEAKSNDTTDVIMKMFDKE